MAIHSHSKPLTLLKAYRIANNLDTKTLCSLASISRPYLTRLEQGAIPSPEVATRLVSALRSTQCYRATPPSSRAAKVRFGLLEAAKQLIASVTASHPEFLSDGLQEIHLLYPARYQVQEHQHADA